jgi:thimet oligopeptidase
MERMEYAPQDFAWTRWTPEEIVRAGEEVLASKREAYAKVGGTAAEDAAFWNTVYAVEESNHCLWKLHALVILMNASPSKEVRDAAQKAVEAAEKELVDIEYDEAVYRAVKAYAERGEALEGEDAKLVRDMLRDYRRMGFDLPEEKRAMLKENLKKLSELSSEFGKNINEYEDRIEVTREELDGLPEAYVHNLRRTEEGKYVVTLDYPDLFPFMENAKDEKRREELALKNLRKGGERNMELLKEIVRLRDENARLLGYASHGQFRLETRMAKTPETVFGFINDLTEKLGRGIEREMGELREFKKRLTGAEAAELHHHDIPYLINQLKKERYQVDDERVREYFPIEKVKEGLFSIYSELLSVRFSRQEGYEFWHEDVELYKVEDEGGELLAYFLLDLYPREGKYGHAAVFNIVTGHREAGPEGDRYVTPLACMFTNFPKPNAQHPSLLSHHEVETFFHEFGHVMHEILSKARYISQSGFSTAWDFVEAPSQMLENWVWDKEMLGRLSGHYRTGEPLPDDLLDNMLKAKHHMAAYTAMRQMVFALFDITLHTHGVKEELNEEYAEMVSRYVGVKLPDEQMFLAGFGHLMGYDAGYYGYMWSKVYASDMFTRFKQEGLLSKETGRDYRRWILEKGSSMDEMDLVRGFLGREPDSRAFLEEIGLEKS